MGLSRYEPCLKSCAGPPLISGHQTVFLDKTLPHNVRFLAIILLKNGVDKVWFQPPSAKNAVKPEKKDAIRSRLFQGTIGEGDRSFALHNALVIAKIVRVDYPRDWPNAITEITSLLLNTKDGDQAQLGGSLLILLRVVKELSSAKLRRHQTALQLVTPDLVRLVGGIYAQRTTQWLEFLASGIGDEGKAAMICRTALPR